MKRLLLFTALIIFGMIFSTLSVRASDDPYSDIIENEYKSFISELPNSIKDSLPESADINDPEKLSQSMTSWDFLISCLGQSVQSAFKSIVPFFTALLALIFISAAMGSVSDGFIASSRSHSASISTVAIAGSFILLHADILTHVSQHLSDLRTLCMAELPVLTALYVSGGDTAQAAVSGLSMGVLMSVIEELFSKTVIPFFSICLSLHCISSMSQGLGLDGLLSFAKRTYTRFVTFTMSVFCAVLGAQSLIAAGKDSVSLRAARFAASSAIPVLGTSVGESMRALSTGLKLLRKSVGVGGIALIIWLTLPTVLLLCLTNTALNLCAAFAEMLGCDSEKKLLRGIGGLYGVLIGVVAAASMMPIFMLILLCTASSALG